MKNSIEGTSRPEFKPPEDELIAGSQPEPLSQEQVQPASQYQLPPVEVYSPIQVNDPGKGLGVAGFVLAFLGPLQPVGLILAIVGLTMSRKAGFRNRLSIAGIVIAAIGIVVFFVFIFSLPNISEFCSQNGPGDYKVNGVNYYCR